MAITAAVLAIGVAASAGAAAYQAQAANKARKKQEAEAQRQSVLSATGENMTLAGSNAESEQKALESIMGGVRKITG